MPPSGDPREPTWRLGDLPADARIFLGRLTHLDPGALVRLRPAAAGRTVLWARLPWGVLVARELAASGPGDLTVGAAALLAGEDPPRPRDVDWRWPLPPHAGTVVEEIPADRLRAVAAAAAGTLREVTATGLAGRSVGARVLREALLDHVPIVVDAEPGTGVPGGAGRVEIPQRLVQAVVRMGFLGPSDSAAVRVRRVGLPSRSYWVGLAARYGSAWLPPPGPLTVRPIRTTAK